MKTKVLRIVPAILIFLSPLISYAQQADQPAYKDGDWWKVKVELEVVDRSRSGFCHEMYSDYTVKFENSKPVVYGPSGKIDCYQIANQLLSLAPEGTVPEGSPQYQYLKFPLAVGNSWTEQVSRTRQKGRRTVTVTEDMEYKVLSAEKVQTPKGEFEAFKIQQTGRGERVTTYYYAP